MEQIQEKGEIKQAKYWLIKTPTCSNECVRLLSTKAELQVGSKVKKVETHNKCVPISFQPYHVPFLFLLF